MDSLVLTGLSCASCSEKIEDKVKSLKGVKNAFVDFPNGKLVIEGNERELNRITKEATEIVKKIEPGVDVVVEEGRSKDSHEDAHEHSHGVNNNKKELIRLVVGGEVFWIINSSQNT